MKDLTLKDVLYALEYRGASLFRGPEGWVLITADGEPKVHVHVAEDARDHPDVVRTDDDPYGPAVYGWRPRAA